MKNTHRKGKAAAYAKANLYMSTVLYKHHTILDSSLTRNIIIIISIRRRGVHSFQVAGGIYRHNAHILSFRTYAV